MMKQASEESDPEEAEKIRMKSAIYRGAKEVNPPAFR